MNVEILLYDGFDDLDAFGPFEVLANAGFPVTLVALDPDAGITSRAGARILPHGAPSPAAGLLIVPGGGWLAREGPGAWREAQNGAIPRALATRHAAGGALASVCTGGMLLAEAGLLAGRPATTHHGALDDLAAAGARVVRDVRVVDDGDILTAGGVTSGIDLALWLVEREQGKDAAERAADWIEHYGDRRVRRPVAPPASPLALPETELAVETLRYVESLEPAFLLNHSIRSYLFARAIGEREGMRPGEDYDDELLFVAALLHDVGLTDPANGHQRFEVDGADLAVAFLADRGVVGRRAEIVWDAIALHSSLGIANRKGPEIALAHAGIGIDVGGRDLQRLPDGLADAVHEAYPRLGLGPALSDAIIAQAHGKPAKAPPYSLAGQLVRERYPGTLPTWNDMIAAAPWGDGT